MNNPQTTSSQGEVGEGGANIILRATALSKTFDDGRLKSASYDSGEGFGLRVVAGETAGYAHAAEVSEAAIGRAAASASLDALRR